MSNLQEKLEVVDENDNVIGLETREKIHREGLLHREIHIWFITPKGEIIFQHRAKNKDTYPDLLDATVGGHVEPEMSYEETAIKECKEETGIDIAIDKLMLLSKKVSKGFDKITGRINNATLSRYAYLYEGSLDDLQVEEGKAEGFEVWKIENLLNLSEKDKSKFIPFAINQEMLELFIKAKGTLLK